MRKIIVLVNGDKLFFDSSIKEVIKKHGNAFVQAVYEGKDDHETLRIIRSALADFTCNGDSPAEVVISGFEYNPDFLDIIEKFKSKLIWAC